MWQIRVGRGLRVPRRAAIFVWAGCLLALLLPAACSLEAHSATVAPAAAPTAPAAAPGAAAAASDSAALAAAGPTAAPSLAAAAAPTVTATPAPTRAPTLTPFIVTPRPVPGSVLAAATLSVEETAAAASQGTPTATPRNMITATYTPRPVVVTKTPTPANEATAEYVALLVTAQALTTGTPTPFQPWVVLATETPTPTDYPTLTPRPTGTARPPATATPTRTATPVMVPLADVRRWAAPTATPEQPFPAEIKGKILFMSDLAGSPPQAYALNPDGSGGWLLTSTWPYKQAEARDAYAPGGSLRAFAERGQTGGKIALYYFDSQYNSQRQLTQFGKGIAWAPAWSPTSDQIAFVSNDSGNDEIWVVQKDQWPARQLTHNTWEWDHHPSWSPDGTQIVFSSNRGGHQQLWLMAADGSNQRPLTDGTFEAWDPVWVK